MSRKVVRGTRLDISFTFAGLSPARVTAAISPKCTWLLSHPSGPMGLGHGKAEISKSMRLSDNIVCRFRNPAGFSGKRGKGRATEEREARANRRREMVTFIKAKLLLCIARLRLCDVLSPDYAREQPSLVLLWINASAKGGPRVW